MSYEYRVSVPDEFFAKSKTEYCDWRFAFIRELIQNSFDAGATVIDFHTASRNGLSTFSCTDNGCGMERDIIENALLVLGGSHKNGASVGGFGYAKNVLFFAHDSYAIHTQNWLVNGKGGSYNIVPADSYLKGTHITVNMLASTMSCDDFESLLRSYVGVMRLNKSFTITLNGSALEFDTVHHKYAVDKEFGVLRFSDTVSSKRIQITVVVNGLPMFTHTDYGDRGCSGVFEVRGASYDVLTTNREGFRGDSRQLFVSLIHEVVFNRFSLQRKPKITVLVNEVHAQDSESKFDLSLDNPNLPDDFIIHIANEKKESTREAVNETVSFVKKAWVQKLAHTFQFYTTQVLQCDYARANGVSTDINGLLRDPVNNLICAGFTFDPDLEGVNGCSGRIRYVMCNPKSFSSKFWYSDVLDLVLHELTHIWVSGHGESFVDVEMKLRRSFRRSLSEAEAKSQCKSFLNSLGFNNDRKL